MRIRVRMRILEWMKLVLVVVRLIVDFGLGFLAASAQGKSSGSLACQATSETSDRRCSRWEGELGGSGSGSGIGRFGTRV